MASSERARRDPEIDRFAREVIRVRRRDLASGAAVLASVAALLCTLGTRMTDVGHLSGFIVASAFSLGGAVALAVRAVRTR